MRSIEATSGWRAPFTATRPSWECLAADRRYHHTRHPSSRDRHPAGVPTGVTSNPTSPTNDLYDGEGNRVEQVATTNGTTTTMVYVDNPGGGGWTAPVLPDQWHSRLMR